VVVTVVLLVVVELATGVGVLDDDLAQPATTASATINHGAYLIVTSGKA
jgi:hypothetical protein